MPSAKKSAPESHRKRSCLCMWTGSQSRKPYFGFHIQAKPYLRGYVRGFGTGSKAGATVRHFQ